MVIGSLVVLGLVGGAGFFLFTKVSDEKTAQEQLTQKEEELKGLLGKKPFPNPENLAAAKTDGARIAAVLQTAKKFYTSLESPQINTSRNFKLELDRLIFELQNTARQNGVTLPTNFNFSFSVQRPLLEFETNALGQLAAELADVRALSQILFQSRIYELSGVRRAPVSTNDNQAAGGPYQAEYLSAKKISTNNYALLYPYEFTFRSSTAELGAALDRLAHASNGFIVRCVTAEPADTSVPEGETAGAMTDYRISAAASYASRYGRYGGRMAPPPVETVLVAVPKGPTTVLKEKALKIKLLVDVARLKADK